MRVMLRSDGHAHETHGRALHKPDQNRLYHYFGELGVPRSQVPRVTMWRRALLLALPICHAQNITDTLYSGSCSGTPSASHSTPDGECVSISAEYRAAWGFASSENFVGFANNDGEAKEIVVCVGSTKEVCQNNLLSGFAQPWNHDSCSSYVGTDKNDLDKCREGPWLSMVGNCRLSDCRSVVTLGGGGFGPVRILVLVAAAVACVCGIVYLKKANKLCFKKAPKDDAQTTRTDKV